MSVYPFSIGLVPNNSSSVYIITSIDRYWYSLYVINGNVRFMSLDPSKNKPTEFRYKQNVGGINLTSNYGTLNSTMDAVLPPGDYPENIGIKPQINSLTPDTLYTGVNYISTGYFQTPFAKILVNDEGQALSPIPFGGAGEEDFFPSNFYIVFVPVVIIQDAEFDTAWENNNGTCQSPSDITPFLTNWMLGNSGCIPGSPNKCVYTTLAECKTNLVVPYCLEGQTCGECVGTCSTGLCAYDYCAHASPYYSCNPVCPEPPNENNTTLRNFFIAMAVFTALMMIIAVIAKYKKTAIFLALLLVIWIILAVYYNNKTT